MESLEGAIQMYSRGLARSVAATFTIAALTAVLLGIQPTAASQGSLSFQATVSGKGMDSGAFSHAESATQWFNVIGCSIVKQKAVAIFGAYTYEVRTTGV